MGATQSTFGDFLDSSKTHEDKVITKLIAHALYQATLIKMHDIVGPRARNADILIHIRNVVVRFFSSLAWVYTSLYHGRVQEVRRMFLHRARVKQMTVNVQTQDHCPVAAWWFGLLCYCWDACERDLSGFITTGLNTTAPEYFEHVLQRDIRDAIRSLDNITAVNELWDIRKQFQHFLDSPRKLVTCTIKLLYGNITNFPVREGYKVSIVYSRHALDQTPDDTQRNLLRLVAIPPLIKKLVDEDSTMKGLISTDYEGLYADGLSLTRQGHLAYDV